MGILNVTPNSFADGGRFTSMDAALAHAEQLIEEGAHLLDIGGESTRPGAEPVPSGEEIRRVLPVVRTLAKRFPQTPLSIDTMKAEVAHRCLEEGASLINDVSALRGDPRMPEVARRHGVPVVLMHMLGDPRTMQDNPVYQNVIEEIKMFFRKRIEAAERAGLSRRNLLLDPGIGFGKTLEHNVEILRGLGSFLDLGCLLVVGTSRKSFIGRLLAGGGTPLPAEDRLEGTLATHLWAVSKGAHILRVHDVKATRRALGVWRALE
ncbi:MAG: dihydropteroate synthase [Elusimicrobia bacterium]|nr:dihydropteroate synthase [Elusimicrobiota bacterium]